MTAADRSPAQRPALLTAAERDGLAAAASARCSDPDVLAVLRELVEPIDAVTVGWRHSHAVFARNHLLRHVHLLQIPYWRWDEDQWVQVIPAPGGLATWHEMVALGHLLGGHHTLHHRIALVKIRKLADAVYGRETVEATLESVRNTFREWGFGPTTVNQDAINATLDLLLVNGSPRLEDITASSVETCRAACQSVPARRRSLAKLTRVLASRGIIPSPLTGCEANRGPRPDTTASVPAVWLEWAQRWSRLSTCQPKTVKSMFASILVAGRWAADRQSDAVDPARWTRQVAAQYVADTVQAHVGDWCSQPNTKARLGQPLRATGMNTRIEAVRAFFTDLIDWEWITGRFDPRQVLRTPPWVQAQIGPDPRIIDDAAWAKLMAAGLTLNPDDLRPGDNFGRSAAGRRASRHPIEMDRALIGVWLFAGCRIDEIRRLELDCVTWDEGRDEQTGQTYPICLLRVPQNKTSRPFTKPVDPIVGQLIGVWQQIRPPQPDILDPKTGTVRQHLFCYRAHLIGLAYLNASLIPALCRKAGIPQSDSRGALTSHRARATIATQLLNAREPLSLPDLQQWLGHKHPSSTLHYAKILQRTLSAAYNRADYFARNVRTIQVLIDRESILTGAATGGGQPWKYYDLGEGYCSYDFFAKCPHRMACARCPFYVPKQTSQGQLLAVKAGVDQMLEQLDLTDDERDALEGDRAALSALVNRLADVPTPAGPTPRELDTSRAFIPLDTVRATVTRQVGGPQP